MICAAHPRQMAHWICLGQWHCSFDIIPKHWHSLQYPLLSSLYDQITLGPSSISMCCLLWCCWGLFLFTLDLGFKQDWRLSFSGAQTHLLSRLFRCVYMMCGWGIDAAFCCNPYPLYDTRQCHFCKYLISAISAKNTHNLNLYLGVNYFSYLDTLMLHKAVYYLNHTL